MGTVVVWWLWMQVIGLAALPLAFRFFRRLPDRGYAFARPLGLLLSSYVFWLGGSLGFLRNSLGGALFSLLVVAVACFVYYRRASAPGDLGLGAWLRANGRLILAVELLFAGAFALWSLLRAYSPEITTAGGEKFMEIMYLNSIGRSDSFPPHDSWLSGYAISYYYFGYVMMAMLTRLSGFAAHLTFNVGLGLLFALTCTGAFGLVYNLVKGSGASEQPAGSDGRPIAYGYLGCVLVAVLGNLEGLLEALYSLRILPAGFWRWLDILDINQPFDPALAPSLMPSRSGWWWWRASRVINDLDPLGRPMGIEPIDEFPGFSFLLGDMHPHVLALPFVLLALAIALASLRQGADGSVRREGSVPWWEPLKRLSLLVPLCLGALGFLNTWDFPIYLSVFVIAHALGRWPTYKRWTWRFVREIGLTGAAVAVSGFIFYVPFYIGFQSQAGGILPTLYVGTRFRQYFVMFGPFLLAIASLLTVLALQLKRNVPAARLVGGWLRWTAAFLLVPLAAMLLMAVSMLLMPDGRQFLDDLRRNPLIYPIVGDAGWPLVFGKLLLVKLRTWAMPLIVSAMAGLGAVLLLRISAAGTNLPTGDECEVVPAPIGSAGRHQPSVNPSLQFAIFCAVIGLLLTLSVEFLYLVDIFGVRMNTIFKFYFQAWVLMAIASAFALFWLSRQRGWLRTVCLTGCWLLLAAAMFYPVLGNISRAGNFDHPPTLDGTAYLATSQPGDYAATNWLNENVAGAPVILEAPATGGSSYVYEGRVSALTGLPTLLGWAGHEAQWRGNNTVQAGREPDIEMIYNTLDAQTALDLLNEYDVRYVYIGPLEQARYDPRGLAKFDSMMDVVYRNEGVTIYKVRQ